MPKPPGAPTPNGFHIDFLHRPGRPMYIFQPYKHRNPYFMRVKSQTVSQCVEAVKQIPGRQASTLAESQIPSH